MKLIGLFFKKYLSFVFKVPLGYIKMGDMAIPEWYFTKADEASNSSKTVVSNPNLTWPRARVPFVIDNNICK